MNILIADHRPFVRKGLVAMVDNALSIKHIHESSSEEETLNYLKSNKIDLILANWKFGKHNGIELARAARNSGFQGKVLLLVTNVTILEFTLAHDGLIDGLLLQTASVQDFIHALHVVQSGKRYFDSQVTESFLANTLNTSQQSTVTDTLTAKELEVLRELGHGKSNREIAQSQFVTEYTVKKHVSQVLSKLNVADRTQAALYANVTGISNYEVIS